jgi:hypothetical protein
MRLSINQRLVNSLIEHKKNNEHNKYVEEEFNKVCQLIMDGNPDTQYEQISEALLNFLNIEGVNINIVQKCGYGINKINITFLTCLLGSDNRNSEQLLDLILKVTGVNPNIHTLEYLPLFDALNFCSVKPVIKLLVAGADPNIVLPLSMQICTPLSRAVYRGKVYTKLLLGAGADPYKKNTRGIDAILDCKLRCMNVCDNRECDCDLTLNIINDHLNTIEYGWRPENHKYYSIKKQILIKCLFTVYSVIDTEIDILPLEMIFEICKQIALIPDNELNIKISYKQCYDYLLQYFTEREIDHIPCNNIGVQVIDNPNIDDYDE